MAGAGAMVLLLSLGSIYFRGYLVPRTSTLTKAYLPDRVLLWFGKDQQRSSTDAEFRPEEILSNAGAIGPCEHDNDLCLQPEFRTAWHDRIETVEKPNPQPERLEAAINRDSTGLTFEEVDQDVAAINDNAIVGQWISSAAVSADMAAADILPARVPSWERLTPTERMELLATLRFLLETCPACGASIQLEDEEVESCCRSYDVVRTVCLGCNVRLCEFEWT
jgi:hypothetical protein